LVRAAFLLFSTTCFLATSAAQEPGAEAEQVEGQGKEPFNAGELIMEHIGDSHDWHIVGHMHLPLPVILKTGGGFEFFSSAHFTNEEHKPMPYQGKYGTYALHHNKVIAIDAAGNEDEVATAALLDLSITKNVATLLFCAALMLMVFIGMARGYAKRGISAPKGIATFLEPIVLFVRDDIAKNAIGHKHYQRFVPYLLSLFFFIWFLNLIGLIPVFPFGGNVTGNIATPLVLAMITLLVVTFMANRHYWRHVFAMPGVPIPVLILLTPIEIMGHFLRPIILIIRLFANIMAGHIVLLVFFCLIFIFGANGLGAGLGASIPAMLFGTFINCMELLVGLLQAYVFTLLTSIYIGTAMAEPHHDHH
jgi:F-type H+-transporting ATPase subunit a